MTCYFDQFAEILVDTLRHVTCYIMLTCYVDWQVMHDYVVNAFEIEQNRFENKWLDNCSNSSNSRTVLTPKYLYQDKL